MSFINWVKARINSTTVVSVVVGTATVGLIAFGLKKLRIKPVTEAVNVATKGAKK